MPWRRNSSSVRDLGLLLLKQERSQRGWQLDTACLLHLARGPAVLHIPCYQALAADDELLLSIHVADSSVLPGTKRHYHISSLVQMLAIEFEDIQILYGYFFES
jgi:hypothetical protein